MSGNIKRVIILVLIILIIFFIRRFPAIQDVKQWVEGFGIWAPVMMVLIYILGTLLFLPGLLLTLLSGATFGLMKGFAIVSFGSTLGAALAFLISRHLARERVAKMASGNPRFAAIDEAIGEGGWKVVALMRLSPAIPFNAQNYLYGLTSIHFWPCILTSWIAMMPGTFLYVYLGHVSGVAISGTRERGGFEWGLLFVGLIATAAVTIYVTKLARQKLNEKIPMNKQSVTSP